MISGFWTFVDRTWDQLASVKLTIVILVGLLVLSIPGTVVMQHNISNIDPGLQYEYEFWRFGELTQLFTAYHSFWYVALMVVLSLNLIACSVNRWPQMWKAATAKPVAFSEETFMRSKPEFRSEWSSPLPADQLKEKVLSALKRERLKPVVVLDDSGEFQIAFQTGRWARIANYLVHTSLLVIFSGAIVTSLYGFEGAANIAEGSAVDSLIIFKEGKATGLQPAPGGLVNERLMGLRVSNKDFRVNFWEGWAGRPKDFETDLEILEDGRPVLSETIRVNDPLKYRNFVFYQASYGKLNDFDLRFRVFDRQAPVPKFKYVRTGVGEVQEFPDLGLSLVALRATENLQNFGPAVEVQELEGGRPKGESFWVLKNMPGFDSRPAESNPRFGYVADGVSELYFTGLQIGHDPGAPIYWLGCLGMLIGTFYALLVTHKKYQLRWRNGQFLLVGSIHRLPTGFEKRVQSWAQLLKSVTGDVK